MAVASKDDFVLQKLREVLAVETAYTVVAVELDTNKSTPTKSIVYPWIIIDEHGSITNETNQFSEAQSMQVGICIDYKVNEGNKDTAAAGLKALKHGEVKQKLQARVRAWNAGVHSAGAYSATTTIDSIGVNLRGLKVLSTSGIVNDTSVEGTLMMICRLFYTESAE